MLKILICSVSILFCTPFANANIFPQNNASLNFTQVMFEFDEVPNADEYQIIISNEKNKTLSFKTKTLAYLVNDGLEFGHQYQWKVNAFKNKKLIQSNNILVFTIIENKIVDKKNIQFNIAISKKGKFNDDLLFIDNVGIAINRKGIPMWFLPEKEDRIVDDKNYRTLQMTPEGTLTFINNSQCYETDIYGNTLWHADTKGSFSGDDVEYYHHDFIKLPFDSYLCASYKYENQKNYYNPKMESRVRYNTLIEYDKYGLILWSWNEKDFIDQSIIFQNDRPDSKEVAGTHFNGFAFNQVDNALLLSFRNTSQIYKIDKLSGKILYVWDGKKPFQYKNNDFTFSQQHGPTLTSKNEMVVYNNNLINDQKKSTKAVYPTIQIFSNPINNTSNLIWEYECIWDKKPLGIQSKEGYAKELPNKNILVNVGGTERIFEVTKSKELVWDCNFSKLNADSNKLIPFINYRCYNTSSLFPIYFTLQKGNTKPNEFLINNNGTNNDIYNIAIYNKDETSEIANNIKVKVNSNKSYLLNISKYRNGYKDNVVIVTTSMTNKKITRKIKLNN